MKFYGRYCRNLVSFLAYSDDPYIPGISFREDKAEELLNDLQLPTDAVYADLDNEQKKTLISALAKLLIGKKSINLMGESYVFPKRPRNETYEANEFSTLLNACGRHGRADVGVKVCLGDESGYAEARELLKTHRTMLRKGIEFASAHIQNLGEFYLIDGRSAIDENIIGIVCGMTGRSRPVIGISDSGESIKVSGRAPKGSDANIGMMMKKAAEELGGIGGGHRMAAGAAIPKEKINEFLLFCGKYLKST